MAGKGPRISTAIFLNAPVTGQILRPQIQRFSSFILGLNLVHGTKTGVALRFSEPGKQRASQNSVYLTREACSKKKSVTGQILRPQLQRFSSFILGLNFITLPSPAANFLYSAAAGRQLPLFS